ncbi:hypothetical protein DMB66_25080 [Actinoplanes sp. ATCC 53533]|uniref:hypothetical protein n=1 Tax=Actinoplanes sp. ATCC 53533 TaxID=1288362 RepID=UPI000F770204|nr:hypothetical protein [Actinoplanes sp. ATCC 53533]RSM60227.1 hypothetical protein DMB66_25080 [Actinoplanes sp. ATCC 53533]
MAVLDFTITLTGVDPALAGAGQAPWPAVARALRDSGIDHACVELSRDAAGWLGRYHADPLVLRGPGTYTPELESNVSGALAEVAPQAGVVVDWDAHDPELAARHAADRPAYRLARRLAALDGGAVPTRAGLAWLAPDRYHDQFADPWEAASLVVSALHDALLDAGALTVLDWKCTRTEAAKALGRLRILPDGARRVREAVPEYDAFVSRCVEADRERFGGEPVGADDPLHAGDEGLQHVVVSAVNAALVALGVDLLDLENGDTPGFLTIAPNLTAEVLAEAELARIPLSQHRSGDGLL